MSSEYRMSADGLFYWNGSSWVSALSPDGRQRWDGTRWLPVGASLPPHPHPQPAHRAPASSARARTATAWTKPLQRLLAGWYAVQCAMTIVLAAVVAINLGAWVNAFVLAEERAHPRDALPPPGYAEGMTATVAFYLFVAAASAVALSVVLIVGASRQWAWAYFVAIVALALEAAGVPLALFYSGMSVFARVIVIGVSVICAVLCILLVYAAWRRGPWGAARASVAQ